jgi:hypothetical protein
MRGTAPLLVAITSVAFLKVRVIAVCIIAMGAGILRFA